MSDRMVAPREHRDLDGRTRLGAAVPNPHTGDDRADPGHSETRLIFIGKLDGFKAMEPGIPKGLPRVSACGRDELAKEPWRFSPDVYVSIGAPEGPRRQQ